MILELVLLTALDGSPLWVQRCDIQILREANIQCHHKGGAGIKVLGTSLCVKETVDTIREIVNDKACR